MFKSVKYSFKAIYVALTLVKNRKNIAQAFEKLGSSYIKLGQFLSTRPDLVGENLANSLGYLRDKLPAFDFSYVRVAFKEEFGKDITELYKGFDEFPIAAASVAQVHRAVTNDGRQVAVKILRPHVEKKFSEDISFFYFLARKIEKLYPKYRRLKLDSVVSNLERSFKLEVDLAFEAAAAEEMAEKNKLPYVRIPKIDWYRTSKRVITLEWIEAFSIYNIEILKAEGVDLKGLAKKFAEMFFYQAFSYGYFHADLHQGNVLVDKAGNIVLVDFGIVGRLDFKNRIYVAKILYGFLNKDYEMVAKVHHQAGYLSKKFSAEQFAQSCRAIGETIMNLPPQDMSIAKLLKQLFSVTESFEMETQPQLLLLQKTMIMVEGIGKSLCNDVNLWHLIEDSIKKWAEENLSLEAKISQAKKNILNKLMTKIEELMSSIEID